MRAFRQRFLSLSLYNKLLAIGAFLTVISVFLPWYEDLDTFRTGDMFLGITGPLYLAGFVILLASAVSLALITFKVLDKKTPNLPMAETHIHIATAALNIFLLILVNSVYFHNKFGVNIALKESRFGMIIAFAGSLTLLISAILNQKHIEPDFNLEEGRLRPLIDIQKDLREKRPLQRPEIKFEAKPAEKIVSEKKAVSQNVNQALDQKEKESSPNPQAWRMDL